MLLLKINFLKNILFNIFLNKKHFKNKLSPYFQTFFTFLRRIFFFASGEME